MLKWTPGLRDLWSHGLVVSWTLPSLPSSAQTIPIWLELSPSCISHNLPRGGEQPRSLCLASQLLLQCFWTPRVGFLSPSSNANIYIQVVVSSPFSQCRGMDRDNSPLNIPVGRSLLRGADLPSFSTKGSREQVQVQTPALTTSESRGHEYHPETF